MTTTHSSNAPGIAAPGRTAGIVMIAASALSVLFMFHHPTGHGGGGLNMTSGVHAGMMLWLTAIFLGLVTHTARRGFSYLGTAAMVSYALGLIGHIGAATISGFLMARLAANVEPEASRDLFVLVMVTNRVLAELAVAATSIAFILWAADMIKSAPRLPVLAAIGLLAGVLPWLALMTGLLSMDVHGAPLVYTAHAVFTAAIGARLLQA
ncbi:hypothetical protein [Hyphobacterium sp.]|uniref:hypothetical protein n=1 Tax=Hyphobacterium sp. TaxID=2004662 RepID=UPI003B52699C